MLSRRGRDHRRKRLLLALLVLLAATLGMSQWRPWHDSGRATGHHHAPSTPTARVHCPPTDLAGVDGPSVAYWGTLVDPVHQAACAGSFTELARLLGDGQAKGFLTEECNGCTSSEIVTMWRDEYGFDPASLARLLETRPVADQGGLVYTHADLTAIFGRGTHDIPGEWSGFYLRCHQNTLCTQLRGAPS